MTRRDVLPDLVFTNKEGLGGEARVGGSLRCRDTDVVEFKILCGRSKAVSSIAALGFRRAEFGLFSDLPGGMPWARALGGKEAP